MLKAFAQVHARKQLAQLCGCAVEQDGVTDRGGVNGHARPDSDVAAQAVAGRCLEHINDFSAVLNAEMGRGVRTVAQVFENGPRHLYKVERTQVFKAQRQQIDSQLESA